MAKEPRSFNPYNTGAQNLAPSTANAGSGNGLFGTPAPQGQATKPAPSAPAMTESKTVAPQAQASSAFKLPPTSVGMGMFRPPQQQVRQQQMTAPMQRLTPQMAMPREDVAMAAALKQRQLQATLAAQQPVAATPAAKVATPAPTPAKAATPAATTPAKVTTPAAAPAATTPAVAPPVPVAPNPVAATTVAAPVDPTGPVATPIYTAPKATTPATTATPATTTTTTPATTATTTPATTSVDGKPVLDANGQIPANLKAAIGSAWTDAQTKAGGRWEQVKGGLGSNWVPLPKAAATTGVVPGSAQDIQRQMIASFLAGSTGQFIHPSNRRSGHD